MLFVLFIVITHKVSQNIISSVGKENGDRIYDGKDMERQKKNIVNHRPDVR